MGTQSSANSATSLFVYLPRTQYRAGEQLEGAVHLKVYKKVKISTLIFEFTGREKTFWRQVNDASQYSEQEGKNQLVNVKIELLSNQQLDIGVYEYPFTFTVPDFLPPSFLYFSDVSRCSIAYKLKACLKSSLREIKFKRFMVIQAEHPEDIEPIEVENEAKVYSCCCFGRGVSKLRGWIEKDSFALSEKGALLLQLENLNCSATMN